MVQSGVPWLLCEISVDMSHSVSKGRGFGVQRLIVDREIMPQGVDQYPNDSLKSEFILRDAP